MTETEAFVRQVGEAFADRHPEVQELVLELMHAEGDHTLRCAHVEDGIAVFVDGVEIATVPIPPELDMDE